MSRPSDGNADARAVDEEAALRAALQSLAARLGKTPTVVEMHEQGEFAPEEYQSAFGSWDAALEAAGLDPGEMGKRIPDRELLAELQRLEQQLGHTPTQRDMAEEGRYSTRTYQTRFGSWNDAIQQAMLSTNEISEKDLVRELERLADELGRPPKSTEMAELGEYAPVTYHRRFGSWRAALDATEFNRDPHAQLKEITEQALLEELRRLAAEHGGGPTAEVVDEHGRYSLQIYYERFGSLSAARERALDTESPSGGDSSREGESSDRTRGESVES
ncbi:MULTISPECIES: homing endonuclease associated repeat-containing protein [Halorussus]|uniref:homing endonuclease associated repeat-containing protein n=1 Tax=Halorussus TaxID=1070314 RepID=UPI00209F95F6|nr:hypothetical protein [Halorussus vallis]USZ75638.1 hypothetical protein NGM07_19690 [Halorussus vallis]